MTDQTAFDVQALLNPLPPAATDPREGVEYQQAREAYLEARRAEAAEGERLQDQTIAATLPAWVRVESTTVSFLSGVAKDLEVCSWLTEAAVRVHGFAGLRDGLRLFRELAEVHWDSLYPLPTDADGDALRVAPLRALAAASKGRLLFAVECVPWTAPGSAPLVSHMAVRAARDFEDFERRLAAKDDIDSDERSRRRERRLQWLEGRTTSTCRAAIGATPTARLLELRQQLTSSLQQLEALQQAISSRYRRPGESSEADAEPPTFGALEEAIGTVAQELDAELRTRPDLAGPEGDGQEGGHDDGDEGGRRSGGLDRDEVLRQMERFADFFERSEPHSPIAPGLRRLVRWGRTPLPSLLREVVADESARAGLYRLLGIPPEEEG